MTSLDLSLQFVPLVFLHLPRFLGLLLQFVGEFDVDIFCFFGPSVRLVLVHFQSVRVSQVFGPMDCLVLRGKVQTYVFRTFFNQKTFLFFSS